MIYFIIYQPYLFVYRLLNKKFPATFVVLYYHEIKMADKENFSRQMSILSKFTKPVKSDIVSFVNGEHSIAVTFDDAFESIIRYGMESIEKNKIPVTVFVPTDCLGKHPDWEIHGNAAIQEEKVMSEEQLVSLPRDLVMLGSHTCSHPDLTALSDEEIKKELEKSRNDLQKMLGTNIDILAFPHGKYNDRVVRIAMDSGYKYVYAIMPQFPKQREDSVVIGRTPANPYDWYIEFRLKIAGYYSWLPFPGYMKQYLRSLF